MEADTAAAGRMSAITYVVMMLGGVAAIWILLILAPESAMANLHESVVSAPSFLDDVGKRLREPLVILLLQIVFIVALAKCCGRISLKLGQPAVFGEIVAGILLGPSVLGAISSDAQHWLFPTDSLGGLKLFSQLGVVLFLFGIGAELNFDQLRQRRMQVLMISHASIIAPFALGVGSAYWLYGSYAPEGVSFTTFALFMGIAMSITAFPVLVRILRERSMTGTTLGDMATASAAIDDVTAWCLLAAVVAVGQSTSALSALTVMTLTVIWCFILVGLLRRRLQTLTIKEGKTGGVVVALLLFALLSSIVTELIGIHALFGAFLAGAAVAGHPGLRHLVLDRIEPLALALLLPLFFAFTGLRTQIGLLDGTDWLVCFGIIVLATLGKFGGASLAARIAGRSWHDSIVIGLLMNTRGLMELVVLNIGYDLGFLSERVFAMMVIMAIVTTFATGPLLSLVQRRARSAQEAENSRREGGFHDRLSRSNQ